MNEWESEEEDSNSSEEFMYMYVRNKELNENNNGFTEVNLKNGHSPVPQPKTPETESAPNINVATVQTEELWSPHKDEVAVLGEKGRFRSF